MFGMCVSSSGELPGLGLGHHPPDILSASRRSVSARLVPRKGSDKTLCLSIAVSLPLQQATQVVQYDISSNASVLHPT